MYMTITTGKRYEYFEKTIKSFFDNCLDIDLIEYIFISDDGSTQIDIEKMTELIKKYNISFQIDTSKKEKGQLSSLNCIFKFLENKNIDYWFFNEDDWLFIKKDHFIKKMLKITELDSRIKNVVLRYRDGLNIIDNGFRYKLHFYKRISGFNSTPSNSTWYGYSLNPGLQHFPTIKRIGYYSEKFAKDNRFWDRSFALRYLDFGYRSANFTEPYIEHIGIRSQYNNSEESIG